MTTWMDGTTSTRTAAQLESIMLSAAPSRLWSTGDTICRPDGMSIFSGGIAATSGQLYWMGGPGMVVPAGVTVQGVEWTNNAAAVTPTHQWFAIGVPDPTGLNQLTVVATSKDDLTTAWGVNTPKKLSLRVADGGSGIWTPAVDTPVYAGIMQAAATPATMRGTSSATAADIGTPMFWGVGASGLTTPISLGTAAIATGASVFGICRLSTTFT